MPAKASKKQDEALLSEIRDRFSYAQTAWGPIIDEARIDMKYIAGDPWDSTDKENRRKSGRPALQMDELNQYTNQYLNNLRQSPRGIKVNPAGNGATDKTAELHQNMIRGIEYASSAWRNAYIVAAENQVNRSYGFIKLKRQYRKGKTFDQDILIEGVANPESILYDPDVKKADWSDAGYCFEISILSKPEFKRKYKNASIVDFSPEDARIAPQWIRDDHVVVCGYWKADIEERELLEFDTPEGPTAFFDDEIPADIKGKIQPTRRRMVETRKIKKYITNGIEILERHEDEPGEYIPVIPVIGKELWVEGKRNILSMIRLARDPQMYYCYLCSQEAEEAKMTPKVPVFGYVGQFETDKDTWDTLTDIPHTRAQADPVVDQATGQVLPLPQWKNFVPNFAAYEMAKDGARRAIQAAMGITPLPTAAQRRNEKSGVALEKIENQESIGSFHFTDNFDRAMEFLGRVIEQWLPVVHDTEREHPIVKADGNHSIVRLNTPQPYQRTAESQPEHYPLVDDSGQAIGNHDVTVSVGKSEASQHAEVADFGDQMVSSIEQWPFPAEVKAKFLALLIRMRNLGPLGDEMADLLDPQQNSPQASLQQAVGKLQQQQQIMTEMQKELQQLRLEKAGKVVEGQWKTQIEQIRASSEAFQTQISNDIKVLTSLITAKRAEDAQEQEMYRQFWLENHRAAHEAGMQASDQAHEMNMAAMAQANANQPGASPDDQQQVTAGGAQAGDGTQATNTPQEQAQ